MAVFEQDVRGLDVAVHESVRVDVRERLAQPDGQHADLVGAERPGVQPPGQRGAFDEIGDDVGAPVGAGLGAAVEERDQPGVAQAGERLELPVVLGRVPRAVRAVDLDRHPFAGVEIATLVHDRGPARTHDSVQPVAARDQRAVGGGVCAHTPSFPVRGGV